MKPARQSAGQGQILSRTAEGGCRLYGRRDARDARRYSRRTGIRLSHSSNLGAIEAIEKGVASSFSMMMPCPWVPEIARYLKAHPDVDSGLHLTLTSEWQIYRWGPLSGKSQVPGLVDDEGCLWRSVEQVAAKATPDEIEREIRAQIDRAETLGIPYKLFRPWCLFVGRRV